MARQAAPYYYCKNNFTYENGGESGGYWTCSGSPEPALSLCRTLEPRRDAAAATPASHRPQSGTSSGRCRLLRDAQHQRKKTARLSGAQLRSDRYYSSRWVPQMWANLPACSTDPLLAIPGLRGQQKIHKAKRVGAFLVHLRGVSISVCVLATIASAHGACTRENR